MQHSNGWPPQRGQPGIPPHGDPQQYASPYGKSPFTPPPGVDQSIYWAPGGAEPVFPGPDGYSYPAPHGQHPYPPPGGYLQPGGQPAQYPPHPGQQHPGWQPPSRTRKPNHVVGALLVLAAFVMLGITLFKLFG